MVDYGRFNRPRAQSTLMWQDPRQAYKSMLISRGYNPDSNLLGQLALNAYAPQLQTLSYAMGGQGGDEGGAMDRLGSLMNQQFDQQLIGRGGKSIAGPYDLSDANIKSQTDQMLHPGDPNADAARQTWLRSTSGGGVLSRLQALEDLSRGGMLPGLREANASIRDTQYGRWYQDMLNHPAPAGGENNFPDFIDLLQGRSSPWQAPPLAGGGGDGGGGGGGGTGATPPATTQPPGNPPQTQPPLSGPGQPPGASPAATAFAQILKQAGIRQYNKKPGKGGRFEGLYSGHPDAPATNSFTAGDYIYDAAADTQRDYNVTNKSGKPVNWGSAVNVALRRYQMLKQGGLDDVTAWNQAVQWMLAHATDAKRTGFVKRGTGGGNLKAS